MAYSQGHGVILILCRICGTDLNLDLAARVRAAGVEMPEGTYIQNKASHATPAPRLLLLASGHTDA